MKLGFTTFFSFQIVNSHHWSKFKKYIYSLHLFQRFQFVKCVYKREKSEEINVKNSDFSFKFKSISIFNIIYFLLLPHSDIIICRKYLLCFETKLKYLVKFYVYQNKMGSIY